MCIFLLKQECPPDPDWERKTERMSSWRKG